MIEGYQINEKIYESDSSVIFRGIREADDADVILKMLNSEYPSPDQITRFRLEYAITKNLKIKDVVKVCGLEQFEKRFLIVLKDIGGTSIAKLMPTYNNKLALNIFLPLAIRISNALDLVHRDNIIHKDINPTNIIWNPAADRVELIDFGISTQLNRQTQAIINPEVIEGTLAYMSPEQTGRMNRVMDYRTDLYSLGVTLFQLITGSLPFITTDPMEMVHCHIARTSASPHDIDPQIPLAISDIIMKLMSKMAEDRYNNAFGLRADLEKCFNNLKNNGTIDLFKLGTEDFSDQFQIPQKLYGRITEIELLKKAVNRVSNGGLEMIMVAGYSGVGKSTFVQEVYRPIVEKRGFFISGKFDQFGHDIPYSSIIHAFTNLVHYLLTESDAQNIIWKNQLIEALDNQGQIIIEVIPELELIIGIQQPVEVLFGVEALKRFNKVFLKFLSVFCTMLHPVVLFLDDLQWADPASLGLIQTIMTQKDGHYLLLLGAYRDNEVTTVHPLMLTLDNINQKKTADSRNTTITLSPLDKYDTNIIIAETLNTSIKEIEPLAKLARHKTGGNPFFLIQFLTNLYKNKLLDFSSSKSCWIWDTEQINTIEVSDNVADLLVDKINNLPYKTRELILLSSCFGNRFTLAMLATVSPYSVVEIVEGLWVAIQEDLIVPDFDAHFYFQNSDDESILTVPEEMCYHFFHDRIQEAAYSELSHKKRSEIHLKAGRLLLENTLEMNLREHIFEIVNHLNFSIELINDQNERDTLGKLNLKAGKGAKISTAYIAARNYFIRGIELLTETGWQRDYETMFQLHREHLECEFLLGNLENARKIFDETIIKTRNKQDTGELYELMIRISHINYDYSIGIKLGKEGLLLFGIEIPDDPQEYEKITANVLETISKHTGSNETVLALNDGTVMNNRDMITCSGIIHELWVCLFMSADAQVLLPALILIKLSIKYGQSSVTAVGHIFYALILSMQQDYDKAYAFGKLAMALKEKYLSPLLAPKVLNTYCNFVNHYKNHVKTNIPLYEQSYHYCIQSGEIWWGAWAASFIRTARLIKGDPLKQVYKTGQKYTTYIRESEFEPLIQVMDAQMSKITNLMDKSGTRTSFDTDSFNEKKCVATMTEMPFGLGLFWHYVYKSFLLFIYGENELALEATILADENKVHIPGLMMYPDHFFFNTLIIAANWESFTEEDQITHLESLNANLKRMQIWQEHCPDNYRHRYLLMSAEIARITGDDLQAIKLYDQAIDQAHDNKYLHHEAVANELVGMYHLNKGHKNAAKGYLVEARYLYQKWGAKRKVRYFDEKFPELALGLIKSKVKRTSITTTRSQALDFNSVMKASQAISGEIKLEKLLKNLMFILMENAGAQKGFLVSEDDGQLLLKAEAKMNGEQTIILQSVLIDDLKLAELLSVSILKYVIRTKKSVLLNDASNTGGFTRDTFIINHQSKSILCTPLLNQGQLIGVIYLENNLVTGAFTPDRLETVTLLSTQAAISIENATLYNSLEHKVEERTAELLKSNTELQAEIAIRKSAEQALVEVNKELRHLASLDGLTGIANRRYFDEYLKTEWQRLMREKLPISLIMCDIDYFKNYNDSYGHQEGDDCLKKVVPAMTTAIRRPADLVARYGGEEFVLVLPNSELTGARFIAEAIQNNVQQLQMPHQDSLVSDCVTLSIGISMTVPNPGSSIAQLISEADQALYDAKKSGRNKINLYEK